MRRILLGATAALALVLFLPASAWADASVTFESPEPDALVATPVTLQVRVDRRLIDPHPEAVTLRLSADGVTPHDASESVLLDCVGGCEGGTETTSRWTGPDLSPRTLSPFGEVPRCNGRWWLLPTVEPGVAVRSDASQGSFLVSLPPSAVSELTAAVVDDGVELAWRGAPETDVVAYRVERRTGTEPWTVVADLGSDVRSFRDAPGPGGWEYRVVTVRPDGYVEGEPAAACTDSGSDLLAPSGSWHVDLAASGGSASPTPSETEGGTPTETAEGEQEEPARTGGDGAGDARDGDRTRSGGAAGSARDRLGSGGGDGDLEAPTLPSDPAPSGTGERYFGEDGPFSERLDYSGVDEVQGDDEYALGQVPGGVIEIFDREIDLGHILRPVATGMVLVGFGLHLRRWIRAAG